jgi:hypothetical protein
VGLLAAAADQNGSCERLGDLRKVGESRACVDLREEFIVSRENTGHRLSTDHPQDRRSTHDEEIKKRPLRFQSADEARLLYQDDWIQPTFESPIPPGDSSSAAAYCWLSRCNSPLTSCAP